MKKKTLALLLSCALAAGMIGGCGSKTEATTEENVRDRGSIRSGCGRSCCSADRCNLRAGAHG